MNRIRFALLLAGIATLSAAGAGEAANAVPGSPPNFMFPDGSEGFSLSTSGGLINPGVLVGFNPQPDPPGDVARLDLSDPTSARITNLGDGSVFRFEIAFMGFGGDPGMLLPAVQKPNSDGFTGVEFTADGNVFHLSLQFSGPGSADSWTWAAFNPQPDPPGDWYGYEIGMGDAAVTLRLTEGDTALSFAAAPEASTWALMGMGFAALGCLAWRKNRSLRASPAT